MSRSIHGLRAPPKNRLAVEFDNSIFRSARFDGNGPLWERIGVMVIEEAHGKESREINHRVYVRGRIGQVGGPAES